MSAPRPEFHRPVALARLGPGPFRQEVEATETERAALARRFDLLALDRLSATVELARRAGGTVMLSAIFEAEFVQSCVVTLDPVPGAVFHSFALLYGPAEAENSVAGGADDVAFEPLEAEIIDIGEAVAQEFSLALPPFPRCADAIVEGDELRLGDEGPFAALSQLSERGRSE
jgi:uncharacterized metal-binding protein YceD (DUF177 family)